MCMLWGRKVAANAYLPSVFRLRVAAFARRAGVLLNVFIGGSASYIRMGLISCDDGGGALLLESFNFIGVYYEF